jgi:hypothetical protein
LDGQEQLGENWAFAAGMTASDYCLETTHKRKYEVNLTMAENVCLLSD